jgi:hypothetical protein
MTSARLSGTIQREVGRQQSVFFSHEKSRPSSMASYHQKTQTGLQHKHLKTLEERNHASTNESKPGDDRS